MEENKFNELLEFAIDRERAAAQFYLNLKLKVKDDGAKALLQELAEMEMEHERILKGYTPELASKDFVPPKVTDLRISDFLVQKQPNEAMTYQEVMILAIKSEETSQYLYKSLAARAEEPQLKNMFLRLATEEAKHKNQLETLYDENIYYEF